MRRPRRNHSAAFKAKVAIAEWKDDQTLAALAQQFDVHAKQITQWKTELLECASDVFASAAEKRQGEPDLKVLHAKIGQLTLENDFYPARSVESAIRAQSDDRPCSWAAGEAVGTDPSTGEVVGLLPTSTGVGIGSGADAAHGRAASGASVRGRPHAARHATPRWS